MRWRIASAPSLLNDLDAKAPGAPAWDAELFRARGSPPGRWSIAHEAGRFHLAAAPGDRALGEGQRLSA
jgi:protein ImuA